MINCVFFVKHEKWVKELQTVRNKWAHLSAETAPALRKARSGNREDLQHLLGAAAKHSVRGA